MRLPTTVFLCALALGCVVALPCCGRSDEWQTLKSGGVVLEYQPSNEKAARALMPELVKVAGDPKALNRAAMTAQLHTLSSKRNDILQYIAAHIGLDKPGPLMTQAYDGMLRAMRTNADLLCGFNRFRLWDREKLKTAAGTEEAGLVTYVESEDRFQPRLDIGLTIGGYSPKAAPEMPSREKVYTPLWLAEDGSWRQSVEQWKGAISWFCDSARVSQNIFHETVECGIVGDFGLRTAYRRWFCEGAANAVAELSVGEFFGRSARRDVEKLTDVGPCAALRPRVDLIGWRAMELLDYQPKQVKGLNDAHYNYATYEVRRLIERHGPATVAKVIKEIGKTQPQGSRAILNAIKTATGEDVEPRLREYGSQVKDEFPGLAVAKVAFSLSKPDGKGELRPLKPGEEVVLDGKHDLAVSFDYAVLEKPWKARFDAVGPGTTFRASGTLDRLAIAWIWIGLPVSKHGANVKSGDYKLQLYFNDKLFKEMHVKLVNRAAE